MNILYLLFMLVTLYLTVLYESPSLCALFLFLLFFSIWGIFQLFSAYRHLNLSLPDSAADMPKTHTASFLIKVSYTGSLAVPRAKATLKITDRSERTVASCPLEFSLLAKETKELPIQLTSNLCGRFQCRISDLKLYSSFSILCKKKKSFYKAPVIFYPCISPIPLSIAESTRYFPADSADTENMVPGFSECFAQQIREFLPGDHLRQIHWKLSAKTDSVLVRDTGKPDGYPVLLFLQLSELQGKESAFLYSRFLECAASLSFSLMEARCSHYVIWYDIENNHLTRCPVKTQKDWESFLYTLLSLSFYSSQKELAALYRQEYPSDTWNTSLFLNSSLQLTKNDESTLLLKPETWAQQLGDASLII